MKASQGNLVAKEATQAISAADLNLIFEIEELDTRLEMQEPTQGGSVGRCSNNG
jgi:hypothetical protein